MGRQADLARGLAIVDCAVTAHTTLLVPGAVLPETVDGQQKLIATNLEMGITCRAATQIEQDGALTVPAQTLPELVQTLLP